ncbi:MAG TPA: glycosyltransferase family 39 protein [Chthoniobacterales bacterium]|jgi:4-amino-4-deoxy-L-arabinose transferase-like glycosyltransferase
MSQPTVAALDTQVITAGPLALPPQRRLMVALMMALALLLQVATSGWGPVGNGADGMNAAIARELALGMRPAEISKQWHHPVSATAVQWLTAQSFHLFNVNEFAARLPFAAANLLVVLLVFLIGDRTGGFWRGLSAGFIAATMSGTVLEGRDGGGAALTALWLTLSFYAAVRMLEQNCDRQWQVFYWVALGGLLLLRQPGAAVLSLSGVWVAFACFRVARIRLQRAHWITGNLLFLAAVMFFYAEQFRIPAGINLEHSGRYLWTLFPWAIVMLPPFLCRMRRVIRLREITPAEAVLGCVFLFATVWLLVSSGTEKWPASAACLGPVFALFASLIWERTGSHIRMLGVGCLIATAVAAMTLCERVAGPEWLHLLQPIWWMSSGVIIVFGISAMIALYHRHSRAALLTIAASTIPLSFNLLDARARYDWLHTMKDLGKKTEIGYMPGSKVFIDSEPDAVSSFLFYAPHGLGIYPLRSASSVRPSSMDFLLVSRVHTLNLPAAEKIGTNSTHSLLRVSKP